MFAVIKTGGKQYRVAANDQITIEKLVGSAGETVAFEHVLMLTRDGVTTVGAPTVAGASVAAEIVEQGRGDKVISFKKRRRQNSKRKRGHRQDLTVVRITDILTDGAKVTVTAKAPVAVAAGAVAVAAALAPKAAKASAPAAGGMDTSNLSLIAGIGPTIEKKLRAAGIQTWNEIAAWTADDVAKWDAELALRGRATREEWVEQARELLAGKPPRAKADQAELKSGKDL
ncbi:MAG: 50S ribosomal protein L21 [Beijerinckiaceae bacterium]|jgi:large subunit ribosomal protein L21|nr:50S ribosomal protein L21 [Beijerinckiaceae bacterium]